MRQMRRRRHPQFSLLQYAEIGNSDRIGNSQSALTERSLMRFAPVIEGELKRYVYLSLPRTGRDSRLNSNTLKYVFARLFGSERTFEEQQRFFLFAAPIMRRAIISFMSSGELTTKPSTSELEQWLERLGTFDSRCVVMIDLYYFCGFSLIETAALLDMSTESILRDLRLAKAWLIARMRWQTLPHTL